MFRGSRRPFDETYTADVNKEFLEDGETNSGSDVSSGTDSDWAVSNSEDDTDSRQPSNIQAGLTELGMLPSKRPNKEVPQLFYSLKLTITSLYKIPIRRPAPAERLDQWAKASTNEPSLWEHYDFTRVREVFDQADEKLLRRLVRLNTRRRLLLQYRQAHNEMLKRDADGSEEQISDSKSIQESYATTFKPPKHSENTENTENSPSDTLSSFASTQTGGEFPVFPSPPKGPNGEDLEDFICPYCCVVCHITSYRGWERHVLCDLEPYVCTFGNCARTNDMFRSREDWYNHELQEHRLEYSCSVKNHEEYSNIREFKSHMIREHDTQIDDNQTQSQLSMFSRRSQSKSGICPLCMKSTKHLKGHLARHLERIALYALPVVSNDGPVVSHDGSVISHDGSVISHDGSVVSHDGSVVSHDGSVVSNDGPAVSHDRITRQSSIRYVCLEANCDRTFSRPSDLDRHLKSRHYLPTFNCPVDDCDRKGGKGFSRKDKLRDHLRQKHRNINDEDSIKRLLPPEEETNHSRSLKNPKRIEKSDFNIGSQSDHQCIDNAKFWIDHDQSPTFGLSLSNYVPVLSDEEMKGSQGLEDPDLARNEAPDIAKTGLCSDHEYFYQAKFWLDDHESIDHGEFSWTYDNDRRALSPLPKKEIKDLIGFEDSSPNQVAASDVSQTDFPLHFLERPVPR